MVWLRRVGEIPCLRLGSVVAILVTLDLLRVGEGLSTIGILTYLTPYPTGLELM
jgi:hypothetical protein